MMQKPKTYYIQTFGCQMNESDSERFAAFLQNLGMIEADHWQKADVIVLNTCSVKQKAEDRVNGLVANIRKLVLEKDPIIILTGCIARRIWDDKKKVLGSNQKDYENRVLELKKMFPGVHFIVETKYFPSIGEKLGFERKFNETPDHYLSFKPKYKSSFKAYVPISTGCNHFCTFCIVPFSRGKEVCRSASDIIREVFDLVNNGYKDITLLGQTVNRWINPDFKDEFKFDEAQTKIEGLNKTVMLDKDLKAWREFFENKLNNQLPIASEDLVMPKDFLQLLQVLDQIPGMWWTTWVSSHPNYMTEELINFVGSSSSKLLETLNGDYKNGGHQRPYLHFALQTGSDRLLKKMNRRHTIEEFYNRVEYMNNKIRNLSLSTDIIVGFITESEDDFLDTIKAQEICKFDMIYISEYSKRLGTAASRLKDDVPNEIKAQRKDRLNEVLKSIVLEKNKKMLNTTQKVLVDGLDRRTGNIQGRTSNNKLVQIENSNDASLVGSFLDVKILRAKAWKLVGEV